MWSITTSQVLFILVGIVIPIGVGWYFYRRTTDKKLSAYVQFASPVIGSIDDRTVRDAIQIKFRDTKIGDLVQLQFVIVNEGQRAIRDIIDPLHLDLPMGINLLDARILHVQPKGREIQLEVTKQNGGRTRVGFNFKLLNKGEFFYVKLLLDNEIRREDIQFKITADDLPPTISPHRQAFRTPDENKPNGRSAIIRGIIPLTLSFGLIIGVWMIAQGRPELIPMHQEFSWLSWGFMVLLLWVFAIIIMIIRTVNLLLVRGLFGLRRFELPRSVIQTDEGPYHDLRHMMARDPRLYELVHDPSLSPEQRRRIIRRYLEMVPRNRIDNE